MKKRFLSLMLVAGLTATSLTGCKPGVHPAPTAPEETTEVNTDVGTAGTEAGTENGTEAPTGTPAQTESGTQSQTEEETEAKPSENGNGGSEGVYIDPDLEWNTAKIDRNEDHNCPVLATKIVGDYAIYDPVLEGSEMYYGSYSALTVGILNSGYDALKQSLVNFGLARQERMKKMIEGPIEEIKADAKAEKYSQESDFYMYNLPYQAEDKDLVVTRADNKVLSFYMSEEVNLGGAHGSYTVVGANFDVKTGKELKLSDLYDLDTLTEQVIKQIEDYQDTSYLEPNWKDLVATCLKQEDPDQSAAFYMDNFEVTIIFNEYLIASYASGKTFVDIAFDDMKAEYKPDTQEYCYRVYGHYEGCLDNDGGEEILDIETAMNDDEMCTITVKYGNDGEAQKEITLDGEYGLVSSRILRNKDMKSFLYLEYQSDNDYKCLHIIDLNNPDKGPKEVENLTRGSFFDFAAVNSEHIYLETRVDCLGTFTCYQECYLGDDGNLIPCDAETFHIAQVNPESLYNFHLDPTLAVVSMFNNYTLISKVELTGKHFAAMADRANAKEETFADCTRFLPVETDGETYIIFILTDGTYAEFEVTREENAIAFDICGIDESDAFDMLPYSG